MNKLKLKTHHPATSFKSKNKVVKALAESLIEGDAEAFQDILYGYLSTQNKKELSMKTNLSRTTIYNAMKGNPRLKTLIEILKGAA